jgi:hypothetical protein
MIVNFFIDSRYGGPHAIHDHLKKKITYKQISIYLDKKIKNFNFSNFKKINNFLYIFDIFINLTILFIKKEIFNKQKIFFVFSIVNIIPIILGIVLKKKIIWYILEKPNKIFYFLFKILKLSYRIEIICISDSIAKMLNINNYEVYFPAIDNRYWLRRKNIKNKILKIICVGNLNKIKNHYQLLKFLENIKIKYKLIIIGKKLETQKNYYDKLKEQIDIINLKNKNNIKIYQNKKSRFIKKILEKSDIFILPSLSEGLSVSLVEAMSMKVVCLVSKQSNHSKVIVNNYNGFVFDLNEKSFKNKIFKIIEIKNSNKQKILVAARNTVKNIIKRNKYFEKNFMNKFLLDRQLI